MGLTINTIPARYEIKVTPAKLEWKTRNADLRITQKPPLIQIDTEQPLLKIDQYQCFAEEGLKNNLDQARDSARKGYANLMKYIAKEAQDGDAMAKIGHKANIMLDIIRKESVTMHEFGLGSMPTSRPKVELIRGNLKLEAAERNNPGEINGVSGTYVAGDIDFRYTPWNVDMRMLSYGSIDVKYTGSNVDAYI
ncbi:DUF6470 family protein [Ruminiclostridium cellobioparum]|uniref:DUF6470 family protein n=1 Tax=Ruminiclostridium cellobioparum TaxID=29355 RepID=UPI0028A645DD|nr:DUF6470 family protein [Ruminiclostridium cellobioparum]